MKENNSFLLTLLVMLLGFAFTSCEKINRYQTGDAVVTIGKQSLYEADIMNLGLGLNSEDSTRIIDGYIHQWTIGVLEYEKAKKEVSESKKIEARVEEYRRSLYLHEYEEQLVRERMPKHVDADSIRSFYERFPERFILKDNLLRGLLLVIHQDAPNQQNLKKWLSNLNDENMENIEKYAYQYASGYELFTDRWQHQSSILLRLPIQQGNFSDLLRHNSLIEMQDSISTYLLQITDKKFVGEQMPLEYATPDIERTILSIRQVQFIERERERIYQRAKEQGKIIYKQNEQ